MALFCFATVYVALVSGSFAFNYYSNDGSGGGNKLLLILVDGCRWDYPDQEIAGLPGFRKLAQNGVRAPYVTPIFPSDSYPNWYTIVTGLYPESHGFVHNMMYDAYYNDMFLMGPNDTASVQHWWEHAEPLWVTAEKRGVKSALYWWDGCQVEIKGKKPTYCRKYNYVGKFLATVNDETKDALMTAIELFSNDEIQLVQVYYEPVDFYGHKYGPNSEERKQSLRDIDNLLDMVQREMQNRGLLDKVNIVVVSDHGMTSTDTRGLSVIDLSRILDLSDIQYMVYYGATSMLLPYEGKLDKIYDKLQGIPGLNVYKKEDIPEHYHIRNNRLVLPILLVASKNYYIRGLDIPGKSIPTGSSISPGNHGYDPYEVPDMRGIFFARGPRLRRNYISPPLQMVDIYNILCNLLSIEPLPNNGTTSVTKGISVAKPYSSACRSTHITHETLTVLILLLTLLFSKCLCITT